MKHYLTILCVLVLCLSAGCGSKEDPELANYRTEMEQFYTSLEQYDAAINAIDATTPESVEELLGILDEMNEAYQHMAAVAVPADFAAVGELPAEAAENMSNALEQYRLAYADGFDQGAADVADQYYARADRRAHLILTILHGEIPSGEGITVDTEESLSIDVVPEE